MRERLANKHVPNKIAYFFVFLFVLSSFIWKLDYANSFCFITISSLFIYSFLENTGGIYVLCC